MSFEARRYAPGDAADWDAFVAASKNATFLHKRGFMDYHADRFEDHSLCFFKDGKLAALLPADAKGDVLRSHGGLTYGGLLLSPKFSATEMPALWDALTGYARGAGFTRLLYKAVPHIYHTEPAEEDLHALFVHGAASTRVDVSATIPIQHRRAFSSQRARGIKKARRLNIVTRQSHDWAACWALLNAVLEERYGVRPVHSLEEIERLAAAFPGEITLHGAFKEEELISAMVIFDFGRTVHAQYIASSEEGRACGGLDILVDALLSGPYANRTWFDFGISTVDGGRTLNTGLARQKEMFGAGTTIYQQFDVAL